MAPGEETDSGMGSMPDSSKDVTPEKKKGGSKFEDDVSRQQSLIFSCMFLSLVLLFTVTFVA